MVMFVINKMDFLNLIVDNDYMIIPKLSKHAENIIQYYGLQLIANGII